jgi:hypothetical protein
MMEALASSETSVLKRAKWRNNPGDVIHHSHRRETSNLTMNISLASRIYYFFCSCTGEGPVSGTSLQLLLADPPSSFWPPQEGKNLLRKDTNWKLIPRDLAWAMLILLMGLMKVPTIAGMWNWFLRSYYRENVPLCHISDNSKTCCYSEPQVTS